MTLSIRTSSFVTVRQFENRYFKTLADFEPFPGALVIMREEIESVDGKGKVTKHYLDRIEDILETLEIQQVTNPVTGHPTPIRGKVLELTEEELAWLKEISDLIEWGQENQYWLEIDDPQLAELQVSPI